MKIQTRLRRGRIGVALILLASFLIGKTAVMQPVAAQAAQKGTIIATSLYVRSGPGTTYNKMTVNGQEVYLTKDAVVEILGEEDGWYHVTASFSGKEVTGYVSGKYVSVEAGPTTAPTPTQAPSAGNTASDFSVPARIWVSELNIRQSAGTSGALLDTLKSGASVTVIGQTYVGSEKWYKVTYQSGGTTKTGYAYAPYVTLNGTIPTATPTPTAAPTPTKAPESAGGSYADDFSVPARVIASVLNVRTGAGTGNSIITSLNYGASVTATGLTYAGGEQWYRISFDYNGTKKVGYVYGPYISLNAAIPTATPVPTATPKPTVTPTSTPSVGGLLSDYRIPATVIASGLNVRAQAGTDKDILAVLVYSTKVTATGSCYVGSDKWYCIEFELAGVKRAGYVFGEYIQLSTPEPTKTPSQAATTTPTPTKAPENPNVADYRLPAKVSATQLNFRKGPGTEYDVIVLLSYGNAVTVIGEEWNGTDKWYKVTMGDDEGYVLSDYISLDYTSYPDAMLTKQVRLRAGASNGAAYVKDASGAVAVLPENTIVSLTGEQTASNGKWFAISCEVNGEKFTGYVLADSVRFGKPAAVTPKPTPTPTPEPTPTAALPASPTPATGPDATETPAPTATPAATATPTPTEVPTPAATPAAQAKENTPGEQAGWGKATHPNASSMVLKVLPKNGAGSVKINGSTTRAVTVTSEMYLKLYALYVDDSGNFYRHVGVTYANNEYYGYILEDRIVECDPPTPTPGPGSTNPSGSENPGVNPGVSSDFELMLTQQGFPESYKPYLRELHAQYPNWVFKAHHTGLLWDTAITEENIPGKNLIPNSYGIEWKSLEDGAYNWKTDSFIVYDGSTWVTASKAALEYYMDPRNFLDDKSVFQFEVLTYEPSYQNLAGVENILKYTPLYQTSYVYEDQYGIVRSISYGETFLKAAEYSGVSPYHLATRVKQEVVTGTATVSNSVTGTVSGFEGLYNFYNIGAYHSTQAGGAIANGLKYAKYGSSTDYALNDASLIPWDNRYSAIVGGAYIIGSSYINRGQNTIYLQKFNMTSYYTYSHQYMANVEAPFSEGKKTAQAYTGATDSPIVFSIPVYLNMPSKAVNMPTVQYNPNNYLSELSIQKVDGTSYRLTPSFDGASIFEYSLIVDNSTEVVLVEALPVSRKAVVNGTGYVSLAVGVNELSVYVIAENGSMREYKLYVVRE
ncbi:MAG: SH3 domain-containing protein [Lachnospiraceae bacterium]|nr:SH3 domain-containing protein [Lachnospiraceae bacterium]